MQRVESLISKEALEIYDEHDTLEMHDSLYKLLFIATATNCVLFWCDLQNKRGEKHDLRGKEIERLI